MINAIGIDNKSDTSVKIELERLCFYYGDHRVLHNVNARFFEHAITAIVGPSGQGKSTLLTAVNRLWEESGSGRQTGRVLIRLDDRMVPVAHYPVVQLRKRVAMVFQDPNPLPMSIFKNVAFPLRLAGMRDRQKIEARVHDALMQAFLWEEVKDRLDADARMLSGGQQQRLCIARAMVNSPEVLLLDEPTASLDARACEVVERLLKRLKASCTLLMVTHYMDQVHRIADFVMEMDQGRLSEPPGLF